MTRVDQILELLKEDPHDPFLLYALALEHEKAGRIQKAMDELVSLQQNNPDYLPVYYKLGKISEALGDKERAIQFYKQGMEVAKTQNDRKTFGELNEAIMILED